MPRFNGGQAVIARISRSMESPTSPASGHGIWGSIGRLQRERIEDPVHPDLPRAERVHPADGWLLVSGRPMRRPSIGAGASNTVRPGDRLQ